MVAVVTYRRCREGVRGWLLTMMEELVIRDLVEEVAGQRQCVESRPSCI